MNGDSALEVVAEILWIYPPPIGGSKETISFGWSTFINGTISWFTAVRMDFLSMVMPGYFLVTYAMASATVVVAVIGILIRSVSAIMPCMPKNSIVMYDLLSTILFAVFSK